MWRKHALRPHRLEGYIASNDPEFESKAAEIIGLYLHPPQHAAVFCVDEKTAIQALDRQDPVLPLSPGRAERHGFEYYRHGTLSLYAAFNTKTGEVLGKTAVRHTSAEFVAFLADIVANQPRGKEIRVIADNLSAHKSALVKDFLAAHPKVRLHFTPTYSLWLNQVELWFSKIERDVIARGVFTSVPDLKRKLMRYIRHYNQAPKTVKWKYFDPSKRITSQSAVTAHQLPALDATNLHSIQRNSDLSLYVGYIVYGPATVAYSIATVHYAWLALVIVTFFSAAALFQLRLFRTFGNWPTVSKIATYLTPLYLALGFVLNIDVIGWWVAAPTLLYASIAVIGRTALRRADIER